jgi:anthranilate/para-aminobenzoate synthase component I
MEPESTSPEPARADAVDLLLRYPEHEPLAALVSGGTGAQNGWTILARPLEALVIPALASPEETILALEEALARTPRLAPSLAPSPRAAGSPPFAGGWIVALGYGLGTAFEPVACHRERDGDDLPPRAALFWCEDAWCLEHATGTLHAVGNPPPLEPKATTAAAPGNSPRTWRLRDVSAVEPDSRYAANVARTIEYIRAGDAFQANVARRFEAVLHGDVRAFAHAAITRNAAWFGSVIDLPDGGALVSMSPELFLRVRADGGVVTRPIKGTRPADVPGSQLIESGKDAAELAMIVDLMRNDLGRVAKLGSVSVATGRMLETHTTVHHGVAEVRATLRDDVEWIDLLAATFPPGSVTGAPKVRAMQIIDELEQYPRGFYCGAIGFISRTGDAALSVAIRTAEIGADSGDGVRNLAYHAGCGIVADSDPFSEVAETHAKTRALAALASDTATPAPTSDSAWTSATVGGR